MKVYEVILRAMSKKLTWDDSGLLWCNRNSCASRRCQMPKLRSLRLRASGDVGGCGVMGWVNATEHGHAHPHPWSDVAAGIVQHMNADHKDALALLNGVFAGISAEEVEMTSVDRLGLDVRAKTQDKHAWRSHCILARSPGFSGDQKNYG